MSSSRIAIVGVTTYRQVAKWGSWEREAAVLPVAYLEMIASGGGRPVLLPPVELLAGTTGGVGEIVDTVDALVLSGGEDYGSNPLRDESELALMQCAIQQHVPVLAICRGHQLLNVLRGGTLISHLPDVVGHEGHQPARGCFSSNELEIVGGSRISKSMGEKATVKCSHHQAVDRLGDGLVVTARAQDATIEAIELDVERFVVGVQWHPEEDGDARLIAALLDVAASK